MVIVGYLFDMILSEWFRRFISSFSDFVVTLLFPKFMRLCVLCWFGLVAPWIRTRIDYLDEKVTDLFCFFSSLFVVALFNCFVDKCWMKADNLKGTTMTMDNGMLADNSKQTIQIKYQFDVWSKSRPWYDSISFGSPANLIQIYGVDCTKLHRQNWQSEIGFWNAFQPNSISNLVTQRPNSKSQIERAPQRAMRIHL